MSNTKKKFAIIFIAIIIAIICASLVFASGFIASSMISRALRFLPTVASVGVSPTPQQSHHHTKN